MPEIRMEDLPLEAQRRIKARMAADEEKAKRQAAKPFDIAEYAPTYAEAVRASREDLPHLRASRPLHQTGKMNKTEARYAIEVLREQQRQGKLHSYRFEAMKFRLADDSYYTPDFLVIRWTGELEIHEVKGHMEDDAAVKLRQVHELFPFRVFIASHLAGQWLVKEVGLDW